MPRRKEDGGRIKATARYAPNDNPFTVNKPIVVTFGRGDARLTVEEARDLQKSLYHAIVAALEGKK